MQPVGFSKNVNLEKIKYIHFTGIKGVGMTALAIFAKEMGIKVSGSDLEEVFVTDEVLAKNSIIWNKGFGEQNLDEKPDLVITTAAHGGLKNPEVIKAKELKIKVITYAEALSDFASKKKVISVCGVGGKSTTSAMIATSLEIANLKPSYVIGVGNIFPLGTSGKFDKSGNFFICEADEYAISPGIKNQPKFSLLKPFVTVVTNIEHDHPDIYPKLTDTLKTFKQFFEKIPSNGLLVACIDNANVKKAIKALSVPVETYGESKDADWQIRNITFMNETTRFSIFSKKEKMYVTNVSLCVPGKFNALNSCAAFVVGHFLSLPVTTIKRGLESFQGTRRRFEKIGEFGGALFYDDYAHHPSEIESVLEATKEWYPEKRIVTIFQPHTYSRTKALFNEFAKAFKKADVVGFMDIYSSARESKDESVSSELLARETRKYSKKSFYLGDHKNTLKWIKKIVKAGDLVLTLGAGDIFHIYSDMRSRAFYY